MNSNCTRSFWGRRCASSRCALRGAAVCADEALSLTGGSVRGFSLVGAFVPALEVLPATTLPMAVLAVGADLRTSVPFAVGGRFPLAGLPPFRGAPPSFLMAALGSLPDVFFRGLPLERAASAPALAALLGTAAPLAVVLVVVPLATGFAAVFPATTLATGFAVDFPATTLAVALTLFFAVTFGRAPGATLVLVVDDVPGEADLFADDARPFTAPLLAEGAARSFAFFVTEDFLATVRFAPVRALLPSDVGFLAMVLVGQVPR